ncbi:MAG: glutamyl-tRNA synthetase [Thermoleophilaceae bacterium]|nr:glutamyl-tRNA synthetase [Thermoleophilaceae bacterium]
MRMEDLDTGRVRERFYDRQLADLAALGIDWDGPVVRQSERTELYERAVGSLDTYPCWCTRAEIRDAASAPHGELPEGAYPGTCRDLTAAQRAEREASGRPAALRLHAGGAPGVDDFVLRRGDGAFAYNLAVVVDDAHQGVDQVVRGRDLEETTPRQRHLMGLLGLPEPEYIHVPLILGPDGRRLAKRHGAVTLAERDESPDETRSLLARSLGLSGSTPEELVAGFDPVRLPTADCRLPARPRNARAS